MSNTVNLNFEIIDTKFEPLINRTSLLEHCQKVLYVHDQRFHTETNLVSILLTLYKNKSLWIGSTRLSRYNP